MKCYDQAAQLEERGLRKLAMPMWIAATRESPENPEAWVRAGKLALKLERPELAAGLLTEGLRLHPFNRRILGKLMAARLRMADYEAVAELCRRVLAFDPEDVTALVTLGHLSPVLGYPEQAGSYYEAAFAIEEKRGTTAVASIYARLLCGDYAGGWGCIHPTATFPESWLERIEPCWDGKAAPDRTVCVHSFGGLGDVVLWVRYVPLIAERVGRVVITAPPSLDRLLASVAGLDGVVRHWSEVEGALYISALQLPSVFGAELDSVPASFPYLQAPATGPQLPARSRLRVGLAWAGSPTLPTDPDRSVPHPGLLMPLLEVPDIEWVSLQVGAREEWAEMLSIPIRPALGDFADTAYVLEQLDLVVTVDTAVANLALAMGVPTWVLPPTYPEFRWGNHRQTSPWYPAARLFRRRHTRDWAGAMARIADALRFEVAGRRRNTSKILEQLGRSA